MTGVLRWLRGEPVAAISGAVGAILEVLAAFHLPLADGQKAAVMGAIPILLALITRQTVTPVPVSPLPVAELAHTAPEMPPPPVFADMVATATAEKVGELLAAPKPRSHR